MALTSRLLPVSGTVWMVCLTAALVATGSYAHSGISVRDVYGIFGTGLLSRQKRATTCTVGYCKNGGACNPLGSTPLCICPLPYTGTDCSVLIDYCLTSQPEIGINVAVAPVCLNGGTCLGTVMAEPYFNCSCVLGFNGTRCSNIDDCASGGCLNGGKCLDGIATYTCNCTDTGFTGANCTINIDDCAPNPCSNGATCIDGVKNYTCNCMAGYTGRNCTVDIPDCSPNPCQYNGSCLERSIQSLYGNASLPAPFNGAFNFSLAGGYVCLCPAGSSGPTCSINPNDCLIPGTNQSICIHDTGCTDGLADYTCHCMAGYDNKNCSHDIDECQVFPCRNGATCKDLIADYQCINCPATHAGKNCSIALTSCQTGRCQNGAECQAFLVSELPSVVQDYRCLCKPGWSDRDCNSTTVASFNGSSSFVALLGNSSLAGDWILQVTFRSSLRQFDLIRVSAAWGVIRIGADNSSLVVQLLSPSGLILIDRVSWGISESLVTTDWLMLSIVLTNGSATLSAIGSTGNQSQMMVKGLADKFSRNQLSVYVGGERISAIDSGSNFRGCVRDLRLLTGNSTSFAVMEATTESGNATWGVCSHTAQCGSLSPCQSNTTQSCSDLWNDFSCSCQSDFGGRICSVQLPSFTFGLDGNVSSSVFSSLPAATTVYGTDDLWTIEMKLLTLSSNAFLLLLGDPGNSATSPRLLATISVTGHLSTQLLHSNGSQISRLETPFSVATGMFVSVKMSVSISRRVMSLTASSTVMSASFSNVSSLSQLSGSLIIGGFNGATAAPAPAPVMSSGSGRSRRSAPALPSSVASSLSGNETAFRGILSSVRLNEARPLLLGSVSSSLIDSLPGALASSDSTSVVLIPGSSLGSSPLPSVCLAFSPCRNGATCSDVLPYYSYSCACALGWVGAICTEPDFCHAGSANCANGGRCVNGNSSFICDCSGTDYDGANCSIWINDCHPNPCVNGGACSDGVRNFSCSCHAGYSGRTCSTDFPDCSPNPCEMNGVCFERSNPAYYSLPGMPWPFNGSFSYSLAAGFLCLYAARPGEATAAPPTQMSLAAVAAVAAAAGIVLTAVLLVSILLPMLLRYRRDNTSLGRSERVPQQSHFPQSPVYDNMAQVGPHAGTGVDSTHPYMTADLLQPYQVPSGGAPASGETYLTADNVNGQSGQNQRQRQQPLAQPSDTGPMEVRMSTADEQVYDEVVYNQVAT